MAMNEAAELRIKRRVRDRDGNRCRDCGMTGKEHLAKWGKALHVHRIKPGSRYTVAGCMTLCVRCHGRYPRRSINARQLAAFMAGREARVSLEKKLAAVWNYQI
jgi:5-methylcytosine-specific restriction endonuclease McrA